VRLYLAVVTVWAAATSLATLPTKQHYAVDVPAGALLAWACHWYAWRGARAATRDVPVVAQPQVASA
jgi:membrane-associated phospholipid phosphatase